MNGVPKRRRYTVRKVTTSPKWLVWLVVPVLVIAVVFVVAIRTQADRPPLGRPPAGPPIVDLRGEVSRFVSTLREDARYRPPDDRERELLAGVVDRLARHGRDALPGVAEEIAALGYTTRTGTDPSTGRDLALLVNQPDTERGWGMYVVDLTRPATVVVEVPHPAFDLRTEEIGVDLFDRDAGAVLAVAGTHRRAAGGAGDVAHRADSMFQSVTDALAARDLPQVQLHGFDDASLPGMDVVLSSGVTGTNPALPGVADRLTDAGLKVCEAWLTDCGELEGRRNQQGIAAAARGTTFVHVELSRTVREDAGRTARRGRGARRRETALKRRPVDCSGPTLMGEVAMGLAWRTITPGRKLIVIAAVLAVAAAAVVVVRRVSGESCVGCLRAQGGGTITATLRVTGESGKPISGATVTLHGIAAAPVRLSTKDDGTAVTPALSGPALAVVEAHGQLPEPVPLGWSDAGKQVEVRLFARASNRFVMHSAGGVLFGKGVQDAAGAERAVSAIAPEFAAADFQTVNLDGALTDQPAPTSSGLKKLSVDLAVLANDSADTRAALTGASIGVVGAGSGPYQATINGTKTAVLLWDGRAAPERIRAQAERSQLVVVQVPAVSGDIRDIARKAIDAGADIVVAHRPQVLQGLEWYQGKLIAYSLGNFVSDLNLLNTFASAFLRTVWEGDRLLEARLLPVEIVDSQPVALTDDAAARVLTTAWERSVQAELVLERHTARITQGPAKERARTLTLSPGQLVDLPGTLTRPTGGPGVQVGRELFGWGHFEDVSADGVVNEAIHWSVNSKREGAQPGHAAQGLRFMRLETSGGDPLQTRPVARIPLPRTGPAYSVIAMVRRPTGAVPELRFDVYHFDEARPTDEVVSTLTRPLEVPADGEWHRVVIELTAADLDAGPAPGNLIMPHLRVRQRAPGQGAWLDVDDVRFVEWREAAGVTQAFAPFTMARNPTDAARELAFVARIP